MYIHTKVWGLNFLHNASVTIVYVRAYIIISRPYLCTTTAACVYFVPGKWCVVQILIRPVSIVLCLPGTVCPSVLIAGMDCKGREVSQGKDLLSKVRRPPESMYCTLTVRKHLSICRCALCVCMFLESLRIGATMYIVWHCLDTKFEHKVSFWYTLLVCM